jgi:hypothetical protein
MTLVFYIYMYELATAGSNLLHTSYTVPKLMEDFFCNKTLYLYKYYSNKMHTFFVIKITRYYNL